MKITKRRLRKILIESLLLESRKTREWIKTQPEPDQVHLLDAYNKGLTVIDQLSWIQKSRGTEPIQDVVPDVIRFFDPQVQSIVRENGFQTNLSKRTYPTVNDLRRVINQVDTLIDSRKDASTMPVVNPIDDPSHVDQIAKVGPWTILMPRTVTGSVSCDISGKDTSWCTTKKKGQNLFLSYVGREGKDIILFYVMDYSRTPDDPYKKRMKACTDNNDSRLSIGFVNGVPVLEGQSGGLSVDAGNHGLTEDILRSEDGLGQYYDQIISILSAEAQVIGGDHPAKLATRRAATDILYLKNIIKDYEEEAKSDFITQIYDYQGKLSPEVAEFVLFYEPKNLYSALIGVNQSWNGIKSDIFTSDFIDKLYFLFSTKNIKEIFSKKDDYKPFSDKDQQGTYNKGMFYRGMLLRKSYLMSDQTLNSCLEKYLDFVTEHISSPMHKEMEKKEVYDDLIAELMTDAKFSKGIHPRFQKDIDIIEGAILSEKGMEEIVNKVNTVRYSPDGYIMNLGRTFDNSKNEKLKEEFFLKNIEHRFDHALKTFRYLYDTGGQKSLEMSGMDGLSLYMTTSILDSSQYENASPRIIQEIESAIYENFPEFFQMSPKQFNKFLREGSHDLDELVFKYLKNRKLMAYVQQFDYTSRVSLKMNGMDVESSLTNLFVQLTSSPHISDRLVQHAMKYFNEGFQYEFVHNKKKCTDEFLLEKMRELSKLPEVKFQRLNRYGNMQESTKPQPGLFAIKQEVVNRFQLGQWTLGNDAYSEIMRLAPNY